MLCEVYMLRACMMVVLGTTRYSHVHRPCLRTVNQYSLIWP